MKIFVLSPINSKLLLFIKVNTWMLRFLDMYTSDIEERVSISCSEGIRVWNGSVSMHRLQFTPVCWGCTDKEAGVAPVGSFWGCTYTHWSQSCSVIIDTMLWVLWSLLIKELETSDIKILRKKSSSEALWLVPAVSLNTIHTVIKKKESFWNISAYRIKKERENDLSVIKEKMGLLPWYIFALLL